MHRIRSHQQEDAENYEATISKEIANIQDRTSDEILGDIAKNTNTDFEFSFLAKIAIALGIAATITVISIVAKRPVLGSSLGLEFLPESSTSSVMAAPPVGFTFKAFGYRIVLPEYAPGYTQISQYISSL